MSKKEQVTCNDCNMKFDSDAELENHKKKFCKQYDNVTKLETRLKKLTDINQNELDIYNQKQRLDLRQANENEALNNIVSNLKAKEDKRIQNNLESDQINKELKDLRKQKAVYVKEDKLKLLQDIEKRRKEIDDEKAQVSNELRQLDDDELHTASREQKRVQEKINTSAYLNSKRNKELEFMKNSVEDNARLRYKQEVLNQESNKLNNSFEVKDIINRGRSVEPTKSSLLNVGNDILNSSKNNPYEYKVNIQDNQNRIKKLVEDRDRTMRQINDPAFDEIDKLKIEVDQGYNTDINKYRNGINEYVNDLRKNREMDYDERARRLTNIRVKVSNFNPNKNTSYINYQAAKPIMDKQISRLNGIIRDERNKEANNERQKIMNNMSMRVPDYQNVHNNSVLESIGKTEKVDYRKPLIQDYENNSRLSSERKPSERVNKSFNDIRVPNTSMFLPDSGQFKQNIGRAEDLEVEERAIMNMYAQDFDDLKLLNMLSTNEELYQHKLRQYKDISNSRIQAEKVLQEQRLEKIRNNYSKNNYEEEKMLEMQKWTDDEKKNIITQRLNDRLNQPKTPEYIPPPPSKPKLPERPIKREVEYDPEIGIGFYLDYISNIERGVCNQIKIAYSIFNSGEMLIGAKHMGPALVNPDNYSVTHEKAQFSMKNIIKLIEPERNSNLVIEVQIPDRTTLNKFNALGWSLINLFTFKECKLNTGVFKLPIYNIPTIPNLSVNDILTKLDPISGYICIRISAIGDQISEMRSDLHPSEYIVPLIHQKSRDQRNQIFPEANPTNKFDPEDNNQIVRDPFYSNTGLHIFLHYLKNYTNKKTRNLFLRCNLFYGDKIIKDNSNKNCTWDCDALSINELLEQIPQNMLKIQDIVSLESLNRTDTIMPILQSNIWYQDFYNKLWDDNLQQDLILFIEIYEDQGINPVSITAIKINNDDGTIKYGSNEYQMFTFPIKDFSNPDLNDKIGYSIVILLNEPKPDPSKPLETKAQTPIEETKTPPVKQRTPKPIPNLEEVKNLPEVHKLDEYESEDPEDAYIPNTLKQYTEEQFNNDDIVLLYFDSCRYLPENVTISQIGIKAYNSNGDIVMNTIDSKCIIEMSTCQKPYFGLRQELAFKNNKAADSTTIFIFRIDTIDRTSKSQVVVGYAFFPLFVDLATGLPAKKDGGEYALQNGYYQLPIFSQKPLIARPITYENCVKLERIPCATLLIRVQTCPKDKNGVPILIGNVPIDKREELNLISKQPKYNTGVFNNQYIQLFQDEMKIYKYKAQRRDPYAKSSIDPILNGKKHDKKFVAKLKKATRKKYEEVSQIDVLFNVFEPYDKSPEDLINLNYFSQYIPEIGFRFSIDLVYNCDPSMIYVVICSINPPGSLYKEKKSFERLIVYSDVNFDSHVRGQKFTETFYAFVNVPIDKKAHMIIDVKSIKFKKKEATEIKDYAWSIFPLFNLLEVDDNIKTDEIFVQSGIYMIPLFQGKVRDDLIEDLVKQNDPWQNLLLENKKKVAPISFLGNSAIVVRCVDNQREGHFKVLADWQRINYEFCGEKNKSKYEYDNKKISSIEKGNKIEKLIPKDKTVVMAQEEINKLINSVYGIEV